MNMKNKVDAITNFVPFATVMTFLIGVRSLVPTVYNYIESNFSNVLVKTDGSFKTIIPQQFLNQSTSNFQVIKSIWKNAVLTFNCKAHVGYDITTQHNSNPLYIVNPTSFQTIPLSQLLNIPNTYYILNFGSSS